MMKKRTLAWLVALIMMVSLVPTSIFADSGRDISSLAVDSIKVYNSTGETEKDTTSVWSTLRIKVAFSEDDENGNQKSNLDIQPGDQIKVTWTAPQGANLLGFNQSLTLYQDDDSSKAALATAVITEGGAVITFNDNASNLQHVKGTLTFTLQVKRVDTYTDTQDGTIQSGDVTKTISITPESAETPGVFGGKSGTYATDGSNLIKWTISFNRDRQSNLDGTVTVVDELPDTQTFYAFIAYENRASDGIWHTISHTIEEFNSVEGRSFTIEGNKITITVPASELNANGGQRGYITIKTLSTADPGAKVSNTVDMTWYEEGTTTPYTDSFTGNVDVPSASGSIEGVERGTIQINKVVKGSTDPIEGIHFLIYKVTSETDTTRQTGWYNGEDYVEIVTNSEGIASIANLNDGYYEIVESPDDLPNWISSTSLPDSIYVTLGGTAGTSVDVANEVKTTDVSATKTWLKSDGETADTSSHPTVYMKLYRNIDGEDATAVENAEIKSIETSEGESSTTVTWENLPQYDNSGNEYTYSVKEVDADGNDYVPDGYSKSEDGLSITNTRYPETEEEDPTDPVNPTTPTDSDDSETESSDETSKSPKTGDYTDVNTWILMLAVSVASAGGLYTYRRRRNR